MSAPFVSAPHKGAPFMRLTPGRTGAAIAAIVTVAVVVLAFDARGEFVRSRSPDASLRSRAQQLATRTGVAAEEVLLAERRDSIAARLAHREWPAESLLILPDPALPAWRIQASVADLRRQWAGVLPAAGGSRVVAVVFADTQSRAQGVARDLSWGRASQLLPTAVDGRTCVVLVQLGLGDLGERARRVAEADLRGESVDADPTLGNFARARRARAHENEELGPCAFLAAFGPPGPAIRTWLDSTAWQAAVKANWLSGEGGQQVGYQVFGGNGSSSPLQVLIASMFEQPGGWRGHACAAQARSACLSFILLPDLWDAHVTPGLLSARRGGWSGGSAAIVEARLVRDPKARFLADLLRMGGRDRFARFWRAGGTLPEAYAAVYDRSADDAWQEWMVETIGGPAIMGPTIVRRSVFSLGVIAALGVFFGVVSFSRRQAR